MRRRGSSPHAAHRQNHPGGPHVRHYTIPTTSASAGCWRVRGVSGTRMPSPCDVELRFSAQVAHRVRETVWHASQELTDLPGRRACLERADRRSRARWFPGSAAGVQTWKCLRQRNCGSVLLKRHERWRGCTLEKNSRGVAFAAPPICQNSR